MARKVAGEILSQWPKAPSIRLAKSAANGSPRTNTVEPVCPAGDANLSRRLTGFPLGWDRQRRPAIGGAILNLCQNGRTLYRSSHDVCEGV